MTPESVTELVRAGHDVMVEAEAGLGIGADDTTYLAAGARVLPNASEVFARAEMIVKVKEPQAIERSMLRPDQVLFTYLHLAPDREQTQDLLASGATCIAYETVTDTFGGLPLLKPMSQVAGRLAVQAGASALEKVNGGRGVLLGGVPSVAPAKVAIIGGGVVGFNAARMAVGLGADVMILDQHLPTLERLDNHFGATARCLYSNAAVLAETVSWTDLIVGAVLVPGGAAPKLITRDMLASMKPGAVLVDVAIDQGGCFETSHPTTHDEPIYEVDGIVHYCVANMPGAVARTSTYALNATTLPFVLALAKKGWKGALKDDKHLRAGLNVWNGRLTSEPVACALGLDFVDADSALKA